MRGHQSLGNAELAARQAHSQRGFYRALAGGSVGSHLIELEGVEATAVPVRPWYSIFNCVFYESLTALEAALPALEREYSQAGVMAWSVWVPCEDEAAAALLDGAGFVCDSTPLRMAALLSEIDLERRTELDLELEPTWEIVARCNDRAYGVLDDWSMTAVFGAMDDPASHLYAARVGGEVVSALIAREQDGDCYLWFVATVPEAQRRGVGGELMRCALTGARNRGCETTSLESTPAGERLYTQLGYRPLSRYQRWEYRAAGAVAS